MESLPEELVGGIDMGAADPAPLFDRVLQLLSDPETHVRPVRPVAAAVVG